jgi:hypothetical protein
MVPGLSECRIENRIWGAAIPPSGMAQRSILVALDRPDGNTQAMSKDARRRVVGALAQLDLLVDEVAYRPAVVRAFRWLPRWWLCDIARVSIWLDNQWSTGWWHDAGITPGAACAACGRRASIFVIDSPDGSEVGLCGWCRVTGPVLSLSELDRELAKAAADSVAWKWR